MELEHCLEMVRLIDAALEQVPRAVLVEALEREIDRRDTLAGELAVMAMSEHSQRMHVHAMLLSKNEELERLQNTHLRTIESHFLKTVGNGSALPVVGRECEANSDRDGDWGYCGVRAVAKVRIGGIWRYVCQDHLEGVPKGDERTEK